LGTEIGLGTIAYSKVALLRRADGMWTEVTVHRHFTAHVDASIHVEDQSNMNGKQRAGFTEPAWKNGST